MTKQRFFLATVRPGGKEQVSCHDASNGAYYEVEAVPGNRFRVEMEYSYKPLASAIGYVTNEIHGDLPFTNEGPSSLLDN